MTLTKDSIIAEFRDDVTAGPSGKELCEEEIKSEIIYTKLPENLEI